VLRRRLSLALHVVLILAIVTHEIGQIHEIGQNRVPVLAETTTMTTHPPGGLALKSLAAREKTITTRTIGTIDLGVTHMMTIERAEIDAETIDHGAIPMMIERLDVETTDTMVLSLKDQSRRRRKSGRHKHSACSSNTLCRLSKGKERSLL
jgi:hypothetical protein